MRELDDAAFSKLFDDYKKTAWRWENQPTYTMPDEQEDFARFLAGKPMPPDDNEDWHEIVRGYVRVGKSIGRVRTVRMPLTDYQRYQLAEGIPGNIKAGEDIRILDLADKELDMPQQDFWLFDDSIVVWLNFNPDGTLRNHELDDDPNLDQYRRWRDTALRHAVTYAEYVGT